MKDRDRTPGGTYSERELKEEYAKRGRDLLKKIDTLKQPLGHGTTSDHIDSILKHGLGARMPDNAYAGTRSAFDLRAPDALTGSYLFARFNTNDLRIKSEQDLIERYAHLNPKMPIERLRQAFEHYKDTRKPKGYPVVLIYDGEGAIDVKQVNPDAESELDLSEPVDSKRLRLLLVPDSKQAELKKKIADLSLNTEIIPIEVLEVLGQEPQ